MFRETLETADLSSARTSATGRQPHDIRVFNRYPRPQTYPRRPFNLCHEGRYEVVQQVLVCFDYFFPDTQGCWGSLYTVYTQKPSVLWRSTLLLQINLRRLDSCGVSDGLPPTRLASSRHNRRLSDDILFHRSSVVFRYRPLWRNRCRSVSHGPPPLLYQPVLVKYPYVEPELTAEAHRHPKMAAAKAEDLQRAFAVCCIRCPCPCLHAWVVFHRL